MTNNDIEPLLEMTPEEAAHPPEAEAADEPKVVRRFGLNFILQHMVMFTSVILLVLTAIPLWFIGRPELLWWSQDTLAWAKFINTVDYIHRTAGIALIAVSVYHMFYIIFSREGRSEFIRLLPYPKDFIDVILNSLYFLRLRRTPPKFGRFSYYEKFDYWAVYWGCVIMIGTGLLMWFDKSSDKIVELVTAYNPAWGEAIAPWCTYELATLVHADEAILATLALFIWHFYNVHFSPAKFPGSMMWLHGEISVEEMKHHHPLEYEEMMAKRKNK